MQEMMCDEDMIVTESMILKRLLYFLMKQWT